MSAEVSFAAMMPASRAVSSGSPFFMVPARICRSAPADSVMCPRAIASRTLTGFALTSTIRIRPVSSTWERRAPCLVLGIGFALHEKERQALERHREIHALELHAARHLEGARRKVEDRMPARGDHRVDDRLRGVGGDGDHGDADPFTLDDLPEVADVVDQHAAARAPADLLLERIEQRDDLEPVVPEARVVGQRETEIARAHDRDADAAIQPEDLAQVP